MLRTGDDWNAEAFVFRTSDAASSHATADVASGVVVPDAHLLFTADFARAGHDLVLRGDDGASFVVHDYFLTDERARLFSPEGASLSPDVITALTGPLAPGQYAQAAPAPAPQQAVGRVATIDGNVTIMRNGVALTPQVGDAVLKGDVLLTASGALGVTFNDGSTLNLTANSRLVVNEFVYDPNGSANSQILDLVQGSLTFISGEVAHSGNMKIGTPVATMGIRGTVGGVTTASDGTVSFYIVQSERGAVLTDQNGNVLANVVQNGPLIVVRPVGPLQVLAQEVQKTPDQLATELAALQHIVNVKAVGDAIVRQFLAPTTPDQPHTQFQIDLQPKNDIGNPGGPGTGNDGNNTPGSGTINIPDNNDGSGLPHNDHPIVVPIPPDLPPVIFAPQNGGTDEDTPLVFGGHGNQNRITVFDPDTAILRVTLAATHGTLTLAGVAGLVFIFGANGAAMMTFTGPRAAIDAALNGLTFTPYPNYNGTATVSIVTSDGNSTSAPRTIEIDVNPVNDAAVIASHGAAINFTENDSATPVAPDLTVHDIDSATLSGAQVAISSSYAAGEDFLAFQDQNGICGSFDSETGILTLTGTASVADYEAALRSVTYVNGSDAPSTESRTITFQVDDGANSHNLSNVASVEVDVTAVNDLEPSSAAVSEEGLANGVPDTDGSCDTTDSVTATGTIVATDAEDDQLIFTLGDPGAVLTSGGVAVTWEGIGTDTLVGKACGIPVITITIDQAGDYTVTLAAPVDHPEGEGENVKSFDVPVNVSDGTVTSTKTLSVTIEDDSPVAVPHSQSVLTGVAAISVNMVIILDVSGSMDGSNITLAKEALQNLLNTTDAHVNQVMTVAFSSTADVHTVSSNPWTDAASADLFIQGLGTSGGTNYAAAIDSVMNNWGSGPTSADQTLVYFISDGAPTSGQDLDETAQTLWETFLADNHIDVSNAIGIDADVNDPDLAPIAWAPDNAGLQPIILTDANGLDETLQGTVPPAVSRNIFTDGAEGGADGGHISSVMVDSVTYTWDGAGTITKSGAETGTIAAATFAVDTDLGGHFEFHFAASGGHAAGDWSYVPPDSVNATTDEVFHYVLVDGDGDQSGADITLTVGNGPVAADDTVITNFAAGTSFNIPDKALTANDADLDHDDLSVTGVSSTSQAAVVTHDGDGVTFGSPDDTDTFDYVLSNGNISDTGRATVTYVATADLEGTDNAEILVGNSSGTAIIGNKSDDGLIGNGGADTFVFKPGFDADTVADFSGHGGQGDLIDVTDFGFCDFADMQNQVESFGDTVLSDGSHAAVIDFGNGDTLTLKGVASNTLNDQDFIFYHNGGFA